MTKLLQIFINQKIMLIVLILLIIDRVALAKQGDNRIGSVRPFVCPFVCAFLLEPFDLRP